MQRAQGQKRDFPSPLAYARPLEDSENWGLWSIGERVSFMDFSLSVE